MTPVISAEGRLGHRGGSLSSRRSGDGLARCSRSQRLTASPRSPPRARPVPASPAAAAPSPPPASARCTSTPAPGRCSSSNASGRLAARLPDDPRDLRHRQLARASDVEVLVQARLASASPRTMPSAMSLHVRQRARLLPRAEDLQRSLPRQRPCSIRSATACASPAVASGSSPGAVGVERAADREAQAVLLVGRAAVASRPSASTKPYADERRRAAAAGSPPASGTAPLARTPSAEETNTKRSTPASSAARMTAL